MVDYPYATSFVEPLPANPVNVSCQAAAEAEATYANNPDVSLYAIQAAGKVFYNYEDQLECLDVATQQGGGLDDNGWNVLYCNEMTMPFASDETTSMFPVSTWDPDSVTTGCQSTYDLTPQLYWALTYFGGMNETKDFAKASNIIFSNGTLDPWQAGGIIPPTTLNDKTTILFIEGSAHHLDLRLPNEADPATLTAARNTEITMISQYIDEY
jgi:hypothetical protein